MERRNAMEELSEAAIHMWARLRVWREARAKELGIPTYVIFLDSTLRHIAFRRPTTLAELGSIPGVGGDKLAKYGEDVLQTLARPIDERTLRRTGVNTTEGQQ